MTAITFKAKVRNRTIAVPAFTSKHCDMTAFRAHPVYGTFTNSDLFANTLSRVRRDLLGGRHDTLHLDHLPGNVTVDTSGFLAVVTVEV
jgi:hypothetical protein